MYGDAHDNWLEHQFMLANHKASLCTRCGSVSDHAASCPYSPLYDEAAENDIIETQKRNDNTKA